MRIPPLLYPLFFTLTTLLATDPKEVVVLANSSDPESIRIAEYYCQKRNIPQDNIIGIKTTPEENISWETYVKEIFNPLKKTLTNTSWLQGMRTPGKDNFGRNNYAITNNKIGYLVICKGIPLKILDNPALLKFEKNLPEKPEFHKTNSSVDAELALLPLNNTPVAGLVKNPSFKLWGLQDNSTIKISRLDGPSEASVKKMIDNALIAEQEGLIGRTYLQANGPFDMGNKWIQKIQQHLHQLGFDGTYKENTNFSIADRFEAPAIYIGWWQENASGLFLQKDLEFAPGAIAIHLHSRSAETLRSSTNRWVGPLIERGATVTLGNVDEPYLQCTHYLHLLIENLLEGKEWGEAGNNALPFLSWQAVLIGDPLYKPFKTNLTKQLSRINAGGSTKYKQYAIIRQMNLLQNSNKLIESINAGLAFFQKEQGLALQFEISKRLASIGQNKEAAKRLNFMNYYHAFNHETQGLASEIADFLFKNNDSHTALTIYEALLENSPMSPEKRQILATQATQSTKNSELAPLTVQFQKYLVQK